MNAGGQSARENIKEFLNKSREQLFIPSSM